MLSPPPNTTSEWNTLPLRAPPSREPTLDCPADERKAWDGALCEKALCFFFFSLLCFHSLCTFRAYFLLSICATRHLNFTGPLSLIYYITDVSQLQQRNNEKKSPSKVAMRHRFANDKDSRATTGTHTTTKKRVERNC